MPQLSCRDNCEMKRFRPAKSVDEERDSVKAAVPSCTKYCTKWAYKIFEDWQLRRKNKVFS